MHVRRLPSKTAKAVGLWLLLPWLFVPWPTGAAHAHQPARAQPPAAVHAQPAAPAHGPQPSTAPTPRPPAPRAHDPLDPEAPVPPVHHRSALAGYRPSGAASAVPWRQANDTVTRIGGWRAYAREAPAPDAPASAPVAPASPPGAPAAASGVPPSAPASTVPPPSQAAKPHAPADHGKARKDAP
jgi:hypothetical protein